MNHIEIIYMDICKNKKWKSVFMMCVSSWRLFFKVNRSNLSVESVCFSMLKWSELMNHCRIPCRDISRKHFVYLCPGVAVCIIQAILVVQFLLFLYYFKCNVVFPLKHVPCFVIFWSDYNTVDGYEQYMGISLLLLFFLCYLMCHH